jgi:hypothetical protein
MACSFVQPRHERGSEIVVLDFETLDLRPQPRDGRAQRPFKFEGLDKRRFGDHVAKASVTVFPLSSTVTVT